MRGLTVAVALMLAQTIAAQDDLAKSIQGTWKVVRAERNGQAFPDEITESMSITIKDDKISVKDSRRTETAIIKLDTTQKPFAITMSPTDAEAKKDVPAEGIFAIEGDTLRLCWAKKGKPRPTEFLTRPNSDTVYLLLDRSKK